jgi:hypothetical protein
MPELDATFAFGAGKSMTHVPDVMAAFAERRAVRPHHAVDTARAPRRARRDRESRGTRRRAGARRTAAASGDPPRRSADDEADLAHAQGGRG